MQINFSWKNIFHGKWFFEKPFFLQPNTTLKMVPLWGLRSINYFSTFKIKAIYSNFIKNLKSLSNLQAHSLEACTNNI